VNSTIVIRLSQVKKLSQDCHKIIREFGPRIGKDCDIFENKKIAKKSDFFRYFQYISSICTFIAKI